MTKQWRCFALTLTSSLALLACSAQAPLPSQPSPPLQANWSSQHQLGNFAEQRFESQLSVQLQQLVAEALINNPAVTEQALLLDRQLYLIQQQHAQRWPQIDAYLSAASSGDRDSSTEQFRLGLDVSWELDWLGKLEARTQAAVFDARVQLELWQQSQLELAVTVIAQWFELLEAQLQYQLIEQRIANQQGNLEIIEAGYRSGLREALDVYLARADLNAVRSQLNQRQEQQLQAQLNLELSLGRYPAGKILAEGELGVPLAPLPAGIPSELLQRRHDLRAASFRLAAADKRVFAAYRERFPSLRLTASGGSQSEQLGELLDGESLLWSLFAGITAPLFDAGALQSQQQAEQALAASLDQAYQQAVLNSFAEVEQALSKEPLLQSSGELLDAAARDSELAAGLAFENYQLGLVNYITVLESQRRAFDARSAALSALNQQVQNRLQLYQALGGGLETSLPLRPDALPDIETPFPATEETNNG